MQTGGSHSNKSKQFKIVKNQKENLDDDEEEDSIEESEGDGLIAFYDDDILFLEEM